MRGRCRRLPLGGYHLPIGRWRRLRLDRERFSELRWLRDRVLLGGLREWILRRSRAHAGLRWRTGRTVPAAGRGLRPELLDLPVARPRSDERGSIIHVPHQLGLSVRVSGASTRCRPTPDENPGASDGPLPATAAPRAFERWPRIVGARRRASFEREERHPQRNRHPVDGSQQRLVGGRLATDRVAREARARTPRRTAARPPYKACRATVTGTGRGG